MKELLLTGTLENKTHKLPIRIYYEDTDAAGVVYNANYLKYTERARTEMHKLIIEKHKSIYEKEKSKFGFVVAKAELVFKKPAFLDDTLIMHTNIIDISQVSATFQHELKRKDETLNLIKAKIAFVDTENLSLKKIPKDWLSVLKKYI